MVSGIEAVADAIMQFEGWFAHSMGLPSMSYRNRNPGNLESGGHKLVFPDLTTGYAALVRDLKAKFTAGANTHGLGPDSQLIDLFAVYAPAGDRNAPVQYCTFVASWCTIALGRPVSNATKLGDIWQSS